MMVLRALLDTDTLSALMRREPKVVAHAQNYLKFRPQLSISIITRYEILRGLHAKSATAQVQRFEQLCQKLEVLPLTDEIIVRAAKIYVSLHQSGQIIGDADILIAATALKNVLSLVSNNEKHFQPIDDLILDNWVR